MSPSLSVVQTDPSRLRNDAPALSSPANPSEPSIRPSTNHLNPTGTSTSLRPSCAATRSMMPLLTMVLPTAAAAAPIGTIAEQIRDGGREIMIGVHQAARSGHDPVPVGIGVVGEGDVEFVAHADQPRHGIGRRAIHADLAVPIDRHEPEGRVDRVVDDGRRDAITFDDRLPEMHAGAAQRIDPDLHPGRADRLHVNDVCEVGDIRPDIIVAVDVGRFARAIVRDSPHAIEILSRAMRSRPARSRWLRRYRPVRRSADCI